MNEKRVEAAIEYAAHFEHNRGFVSVAFLDGAEWALKNQWVSVEERLPETGLDGTSEYVFVRMDNFLPEVAHYTNNSFTRKYKFKAGRETFVNKWFTNDGNPVNKCVTHWMPIPEPPK